MQALLLSTLRLGDYLLDPSTVVTHVIAAGLLCALRLQGVSRRVVALVSVAEELFAYLLWVACPSGLTTVALLWVFLSLYELILGPRLSLKENAVLISGTERLLPPFPRLPMPPSVCLSVRLSGCICLSAMFFYD